MMLEVVGTGTGNKGAELMMAAIARQFVGHDQVQLAVGSEFGSYADRARYGLWYKSRHSRWGRSRLSMMLMPPGYRKLLGIVDEAEVNAVIDASGFAFSDQLPVATAQRFADDCERWKQQGKPIVLLPQALGPFEKPEVKHLFQRIVQAVDLIYARDPDSLRFAQEAAGHLADRILSAPDITIGLDGNPAGRLPQAENAALLVPNVRMIDRNQQSVAESYVPFLVRCLATCEQVGLRPMLLLHEVGEDEQLVAPIAEAFGSELTVIRERDPLMLKGLLKQARLVVGSRFHSLVGALSGGVPSLAAGWSHKYQRLFDDFGCGDMVVDPSVADDVLQQKVRQLLTERDRRSEQLLQATARFRVELDGVWQRVQDVVRQRAG